MLKKFLNIFNFSDNSNYQKVVFSKFDNEFIKYINEDKYDLAEDLLKAGMPFNKEIYHILHKKIEADYIEFKELEDKGFSYSKDINKSKLITMMIDYNLFSEASLPLFVSMAQKPNFTTKYFNQFSNICSLSTSLLLLNAGPYGEYYSYYPSRGRIKEPSFGEDYHLKNKYKDNLELINIYYDDESLSTAYSYFTHEAQELLKIKQTPSHRDLSLIRIEKSGAPIKATPFGISLMRLLPAIINFEITTLGKTPYQLFTDNLKHYSPEMTDRNQSLISLYIFKKYESEIINNLTNSDILTFKKVLSKISSFDCRANLRLRTAEYNDHLDLFFNKLENNKNSEHHQNLLNELRQQKKVFSIDKYLNEIKNEPLLNSLKNINLYYQKLEHIKLIDIESSHFIENLPQSIKKIMDSYNDVKEILGVDESNKQTITILSIIEQKTQEIFNNSQHDNIETLEISSNVKHKSFNQ